MFVVAEMANTIRVPPERFGMSVMRAITLDLTGKLVGKVIKEVGLCVALFDILSVSESFILPGDGAAHAKVRFRLVVFRPFVEELLFGKIKSCTEEGVWVTLGFFDDILITPDVLQQPCRYDEMENVWIWEYEAEDGKHDLFMDPGENIRFRVTGRKFTETFPSEHTKKVEVSSESESKPEKKERIIPFLVLGSISEPGLGLSSWWS